MIISTMRIQNYRSIKDTKVIPIARLMALIGENNCGKSNIISAVERFLGAGSGGTTREDFNDPSQPIIITIKFDKLSLDEKKRWRPYFVDGSLILQKNMALQIDSRTGREKVEAEFHGYRAEPKEWFLSLEKISDKIGERPDWKKIVAENGLPEYFYDDGKCNKSIFTKALLKYIDENNIEYDEPDISTTQALGLQSNVIATLPKIYFLKAITDYSDETDKRSSSSTFRRLMGDLSERILKNDPDYKKIEEALADIRFLLNSFEGTGGAKRLGSLSTIEDKITEFLKKLMPSVTSVSLSVALDDIKSMFSNGISLSVNDGVSTDVLAKGHGLQRCIVFTLLQALILNERNQLIATESGNGQLPVGPPIILAIEEPELYIHPQLSKLFFDVMREFSTTDQVLYATHSPLFIDAYEYNSIAIVRKDSVAIGTCVRCCDGAAFVGLDDRKIFKGLTRLNPAVNELFFARNVLLVEGPEDQIAVTAYLLNEGKIKNRIEELDWSIVVAGGKDAIPFFQRVLNAFDIPYTVLHDVDIVAGMSADDKNKHEKTNATILELAGGRPLVKFPIKLETSLGLTEHLKDQYNAHVFFQDNTHLTAEFREIVGKVFK